MESTGIIDPYKKVCLYKGCTKPHFTAKRLNQGYCCKECKIKANNGKASEERMFTKTVDDKIKRNRKILDQLYSIGVTSGDWNDLMAKGFDYTKHTGLSLAADGRYTTPQFHNYTLEKLTNNQFKISKLW